MSSSHAFTEGATPPPLSPLRPLKAAAASWGCPACKRATARSSSTAASFERRGCTWSSHFPGGIRHVFSWSARNPSSVTCPRGACSISASVNSKSDRIAPLAGAGFPGGFASHNQASRMSPGRMPPRSAAPWAPTCLTTTPPDTALPSTPAADTPRARSAWSAAEPGATSWTTTPGWSAPPLVACVRPLTTIDAATRKTRRFIESLVNGRAPQAETIDRPVGGSLSREASPGGPDTGKEAGKGAVCGASALSNTRELQDCRVWNGLNGRQQEVSVHAEGRAYFEEVRLAQANLGREACIAGRFVRDPVFGVPAADTRKEQSAVAEAVDNEDVHVAALDASGDIFFSRPQHYPEALAPSDDAISLGKARLIISQCEVIRKHPWVRGRLKLQPRAQPAQPQSLFLKVGTLLKPIRADRKGEGCAGGVLLREVGDEPGVLRLACTHAAHQEIERIRGFVRNQNCVVGAPLS